MFRLAFAEDKEILEAIHQAEQKPQTRKPIRISIDKAPTTYRKRIAELAMAEKFSNKMKPDFRQ